MKRRKTENLHFVFNSDVSSEPVPGAVARAGDLWPHSASVSPNFSNQIWSLGSMWSLNETFLSPLFSQLSRGLVNIFARKEAIWVWAPSHVWHYASPGHYGWPQPIDSRHYDVIHTLRNHYVEWIGMGGMRKVILSLIKLCFETRSPIDNLNEDKFVFDTQALFHLNWGIPRPQQRGWGGQKTVLVRVDVQSWVLASTKWGFVKKNTI